MPKNITAIFFDIGGTLRISEGSAGTDASKIEEIITTLGEVIPNDEFISRIHRGEKAYRRWCKPNYIELSEPELWTRFLLPENPGGRRGYPRANPASAQSRWAFPRQPESPAPGEETVLQADSYLTWLVSLHDRVCQIAARVDRSEGYTPAAYPRSYTTKSNLSASPFSPVCGWRETSLNALRS